MVQNSLIKILSSFDKIPFIPLLETDVFNILHSHLPEKKWELPLEEMAELSAFQFSEFLPIDEINSKHLSLEMLSYWEHRSIQAQHPVLVARYSGMIYSLSQQLNGNKPSYIISKRYVEALLNTVQMQLYKVSVFAVKKVKCALMISFSLNDATLIKKTKESIISLENLIAIDDKPGLWGFSFDLLLNGKTNILSAAEEDKIIQDLELRLSNVMMTDTRATELVVERLAAFYTKKKKFEDVQRTLNCLRSSFENDMRNLPAIQKANYIERLIKIYRQINLHKEVQQGLVWLREVSKETDSEMKSLTSSINIPKDKLDKEIDKILQGDCESVFSRIIEYNIPRIEQTKNEINRMAKDFPMSYLMPKGLMDKEGRKVATIGSLEEDPDGHIICQFSQSITIGAFLLHFLFEEAKKREILTTYEVMKFLKKSCIIEDDRYLIIEKGIEAYFNRDYLTYIHLLIPQFEQAIRKLIEINGGNVLIIKDDGYNLITFDKVLKDTTLIDAVGEDIALYYRVLFTDKRGWNLRNNVAHGIHEASGFNKQTSDRLMHAILSLGMIRLNKIKPT